MNYPHITPHYTIVLFRASYLKLSHFTTELGPISFSFIVQKVLQSNLKQILACVQSTSTHI